MDLFLKFDSEEQSLQFLYTTIPAVKNEAGEVVEQTRLVPKFRNIDTIGVISKPTGETEMVKLPSATPGVENIEQEMPVLKPLDGWHVNVRALPEEDISLISQFAIRPANPIRIWA